MKQIEAIIERANDGTYSVYCKEEMFSGMGNTSEEAQNNMLEQMQFYKQAAIKDGFEYPAFLDDKFEVVYKFDTKSLLEYYFGIISLSGMEKITGIHQKQLWKYLHTNTIPRKKQLSKIEQGFHLLGKELSSISL